MWPLLIFCVAALACLGVRQVLLQMADRRAQNGHSFLRLFLNAVRVPSILWCLAAAIAIAIHNADLTKRQLDWAHKGIGAFLILSISLVIAASAVRTITAYGERREMPFAVAGLSRTLTYVFVLSIAGLMMLNLFDISITPILTALGVGGLAVALALQDTLANFFAGVHILIEEPIAVGDTIKLAGGEEQGVVKDIGWRTTRILTGENNIVVIPNTKITSGILTNFNMSERRIAAELPIFVGLEADPHQVAEIVMDIAASVKGVLEAPPPTVLFDPGITLTHMQMKMVVNIGAQAGRGTILSEIRLRMLERFRMEGVPLPSPEKIVVLRD